MPYPPYVLTRAVSVGGSMTLVGAENLRMILTLTASRSLVWDATGYRFEKRTSFSTPPSEPGGEIALVLPRTDVAGWRDGVTGAVIDVSAPDSHTHTYSGVISFLTADGKATNITPVQVGPFVLPEGDGSPVDLDKTVPVGTVTGQALAVPDTWSLLVAAAEAAAAEAAASLASIGTPDVEATADSIPKRTPGGTLKTAAPVDDDDAVSVGSLVPLGSPARQELDRLRIAPTLTPLTERLEPLINPLIQVDPQTIYGAWARIGETPQFRKTTDGGLTWTTLSTLPGVVMAAYRLTSGTILAIEQTATTTVGGSNPRVWRSTTDGASWTEVAAGLKFPPLSTQGICEGTGGQVLIGEYGNVSPHQYRILRSADDGVTWAPVLTTDGTEPAGDPGHFHSVTFDPVAGKHVAYSDRPIVPGVSGPRIYASSDNGATWTLLAESIDRDRPNFVAPMYFQDYIAWGSDNEVNGRISRIPRADFYAGNFAAAETVAQLSQKAMYFTFPLRPDVWAVTMATEHIDSIIQDGTPGSYANEIWVVSDNGSLVTPGVESYHASTAVGALSGVRAQIPSRPLMAFDHDGIVWARMPVGRPRPYAAVPLSQGVEPAGVKRVQARAIPFLPSQVPMIVQRDNGDEVHFLTNSSNGSIIFEDDTSPTGRASIQFATDGTISFRIGASTMAALVPGATGLRVSNGVLEMTTTGVGFKVTGTSPEGVVTARVGTLCLSFNGGRGTSVWIKESGVGNTGWAPIGHPSGTTAQRTATPPTGMSFFDTTLGKPIWYSGTAWVDATGTTV